MSAPAAVAAIIKASFACHPPDTPRADAARVAIGRETVLDKLQFNTVFVSDVHLGLRSCKAEFLLDFLQHIDCQRLYLVGDIIDFWHMKKGVRWPTLHNRVIQEVM